jgi:hypothetical protein
MIKVKEFCSIDVSKLTRKELKQRLWIFADIDGFNDDRVISETKQLQRVLIKVASDDDMNNELMLNTHNRADGWLFFIQLLDANIDDNYSSVYRTFSKQVVGKTTWLFGQYEDGEWVSRQYQSQTKMIKAYTTKNYADGLISND